MFYFMTNDPKIFIKFRWRSGGTVSSAVGLWWSLGWGSEVKDPEKFQFCTSGGQISNLKQRKPSKQVQH